MTGKSKSLMKTSPFEFQEADLVGLTTFTTNVSRAYEISSLYRKRGAPTVLGGIHTSMSLEEALQYADTVVIGKAESAWAEVISDFETGKMQEIYARNIQMRVAGFTGDASTLP